MAVKYKIRKRMMEQKKEKHEITGQEKVQRGIADKKRGISGFRGSSTIEAALLTPLIMAVIFLILFLTLFLYTRAGFVRNGYLAVLRGSQAEQETGEAKRMAAQREFDKLVKTGYTGGTLYREEITVKGDKLFVHVTLDQRAPRSIFSGNHGFMKGFSHEMTFYAKTCRPAMFIRNCRRIERLAETREVS